MNVLKHGEELSAPNEKECKIFGSNECSNKRSTKEVDSLKNIVISLSGMLEEGTTIDMKLVNHAEEYNSNHYGKQIRK